ncbi:MAG: nucleotidyl transferase AbiEii/AbiGii toxin family protein [Elusimicrobiota bacterium]|jgi:predicted nucleotidyltransferase component of viral defense system|nr:nucleotidyl transferase AbiEii/AbiGii toxin family protein [Elusimicrobiota bacterium]
MENNTSMIHSNQAKFQYLIEQISSVLGFDKFLIEKDYFLTLLLSHISGLSPNLIFKGGTCLNKIYFDYHRLSEDLDFLIQLPKDKMTRRERSQLMKPIKDKIGSFAGQFGLSIEDAAKSAHNESTMYNFKLFYNSVISKRDGVIQLDISLKESHISPAEQKDIRHKFYSPAGEPLIESGTIKALSLQEVLAEKLRAGITRKEIAARDFYDLDYAIRNNFNFKDNAFINMLKKKLIFDNADPNLNQYCLNLGRSAAEIKAMREMLSKELYPTLNVKEKTKYNLDIALKRINDLMKSLSDIEKTEF